MDTIDLKEFYDKTQNLSSSEVILDVRNPDEYVQGHVKGSLNIPLPELESRIDELQKYKSILIHCKRGGRAQKAYELLSLKGLEGLRCLADFGFDHWMAEDYPVNK